MATTGYTSAGGWFDTGYGLCRLHGDIVYNVTRTNNTVYFTTTYGRLKHVKESGTWTSYYYGAGWTATLQVPAGTTRRTNSWSGTRYPNNVDTQTTSNSFNFSVSASATTVSARIYGYYSGDSATYASKTLTIPTAYSPVISTPTEDNIDVDTARINWTSTTGSSGSYTATFSSMVLDYGETESYGSQVTGLSEDGNTTLTGLSPNTTYYYRLTATNGSGKTGTATGSFTTLKRKNGLALLMD